MPSKQHVRKKKKHSVLAAFFTAVLFCLAVGAFLLALNLNTLLNSCGDGGNPCPPQAGSDSQTPDANATTAAPISESLEEYIAGTIFIGDSRTNGMVQYGYVPRNNAYAIDGANHIAARTERFLILSANGRKLTIPEAIGVVKPKRIIVSFGVNGVSFLDEERFISGYEQLLDDLIAQSPDSVIAVQSILPVSASRETGTDAMSNSKIDRYNLLLREMAERRGIRYLDTAPLLKNAYGKLDGLYDSGDGLHFNEQAYQVLFDYFDKNRLY